MVVVNEGRLTSASMEGMDMAEREMGPAETVSASIGAAPRSGPLGYGMAPVYAAGTVVALLIPGLIYGVAASADALSDRDQEQSQTQAGEDQGTDSDSETPTTDPDRDSDQDAGGSDEASQSDEGESDTDSSSADEAEESSEAEENPYIADDVVHTVQPGDTLSGISGQYRVPMDIIAEHNGIEDYNLIYIDSAILIPYSEVNVPVDRDE